MTTKDFILTVENELKDFGGFSDGVSEVIQVWYCKTIQNHKGLFIVKDRYGWIYDYFIEATYNGDESELYLDFYRKDFKHVIDVEEQLKGVIKMIYNRDCIEFMREREREWTDLLITDIPYDEVNRESNGLRNLDKGKADELTFDLPTFLDLCYKSTKSTIIIFCAIGQVSEIFNYFDALAKKKKGTVRQLIWQKSNPSPMNGDYIYLSGLENAVWFKKRGGTFNAHCKSNVFKYPCGRSKVHPTEKNHELLKELILDNSNEGDKVFDPCCGSGSHLLVAKELGRKVCGCELDTEWYKIAKERVESI